MSIEDNIYSRIKNDAGVVAIASTRVYANALKQGVMLPAVSFSRISTSPLVNLTDSGGKTHIRVQVDSWAETYATAKSLAAAIRTAMEGSTTNFRAMWLNEFDLYEDAPVTHHVTQDFSVWA